MNRPRLLPPRAPEPIAPQFRAGIAMGVTFAQVALVLAIVVILAAIFGRL